MNTLQNSDISFFIEAIHQAGYFGFGVGVITGSIITLLLIKAWKIIFPDKTKTHIPRIYCDPYWPASWGPGKN